MTDYFIRKYEQEFGEGSWAELEEDVKKRHPQFFASPQLCEKPKPKWWEFWK